MAARLLYNNNYIIVIVINNYIYYIIYLLYSCSDIVVCGVVVDVMLLLWEWVWLCGCINKL